MARDYKAEYKRRIENGIKRGLTKKEASGKAPVPTEKRATKTPVARQVKTPLYTSRKPGTIYIHGKQQAGTRFERERHIDVPATPAQAKKYEKFLKAGKPKTAKRYLLADVYEVPLLAGGEYLDGWDYDSHTPFDGYDYDELDSEDIESDDGGYAIK